MLFLETLVASTILFKITLASFDDGSNILLYESLLIVFFCSWEMNSIIFHSFEIEVFVTGDRQGHRNNNMFKFFVCNNILVEYHFVTFSKQKSGLI